MNTGTNSTILQSLSEIDSILQAENKRRLENNELMHSSINDYFADLDLQISSQVNDRYLNLEANVERMDQILTCLEKAVDEQEVESQKLLGLTAQK